MGARTNRTLFPRTHMGARTNRTLFDAELKTWTRVIGWHEQHEPYWKIEWTQVIRTGKQFLHPTSSTNRVTLVTNPLVSHEWRSYRIVITINGIYPWSFVTQIYRNVNQVTVAAVKFIISLIIKLIIYQVENNIRKCN